MTFDTIFFYFIAALAIFSAILMVTRRNPVMSVIFLIANFFCLAILYLLLHAQFIAIIQILVYAGAIMVLFLFVIMLLNLKDEQKLTEKVSYKKILALVLAAIILIEIIMVVGVPFGQAQTRMSAEAEMIGTSEFIGKMLFTDFVFPFEVTSVLLLVAMIAVIILAKKKFD